MSKNVGKMDSIVRVVIGLVLIAYSTSLGFPSTGWNWVGWIGVVPILTALFAYCPAYRILGVSTCGSDVRKA